MKIVYCKNLTLPEDKNSENKIFVLGQDYSIGTMKNFLASWVTHSTFPVSKRKYLGTSLWFDAFLFIVKLSLNKQEES